MIKVTGLGICTGLGIGFEANISQMMAQFNAFDLPKYLQTRHHFPVAEVPITDEELRISLHIQDPFLSRTTLLGILALREALAQYPKDYFLHKKVAFINSTTSGVMSTVEKHYMSFIDDQPIDSKFDGIIDEIDATAVTYAMADYFNISGYITTISTACSSAANAILIGTSLLQYGEYDIVICGGTDALSTYALNGFYSLKNIDKDLSKPFDSQRNGLNLGEGAAYIILENNDAILPALAHYYGGANTNEAHHPSAPDLNGAGALRTMEEALINANLDKSKLDYINTHGTATESNDLAEANAIFQLFGEHTPPFNSTKSYTGHTLAAAGAVEVILSIGMMNKKILVPNLRFKQMVADLPIIPIKTISENYPIRYFMSNSFGFGGSNVSLIFGE